MNTIRSLAVAAILAVVTLGAVHAQTPVQGNVVEFGRGVEVSNGSSDHFDRPLLRFAAGSAIQPGPSLMEVATDGSIEFFNYATIDFAGFAPSGLRVAGVRGWIAVRVAGEYVLLPAYRIAPRPDSPPID